MLVSAWSVALCWLYYCLPQFPISIENVRWIDSDRPCLATPGHTTISPRIYDKDYYMNFWTEFNCLTKSCSMYLPHILESHGQLLLLLNYVFLAKHCFLDRIYSNFLICQDDSAMDRTSSSTPYSVKEAQDELLSRNKQSNKTDEHSRMCKVCNIPVS